jgi:hypothetical protein
MPREAPESEEVEGPGEGKQPADQAGNQE